MQDEIIVNLCGKGKGCCPTIAVNSEEVTIEDDFGGKVKLTKEEFEILKTKIKQNEL